MGKLFMKFGGLESARCDKRLPAICQPLPLGPVKTLRDKPQGNDTAAGFLSYFYHFSLFFGNLLPTFSGRTMPISAERVGSGKVKGELAKRGLHNGKN